MSILYLDTNALVKLVLQEAGSERVEAAAAEIGGICSSVIAYAEARATLSRQFTEKTQAISKQPEEVERLRQEHLEVIADFNALWADTNPIDVTQEISEIAGDLTVAHPGLRGMDALHLASALYVGRSETLLFMTFDDRLYVAAEAMFGKKALR